MTVVIRCIDGGCSWGMTLVGRDVAEVSAKEHALESGHFLVVYDNGRDEWFSCDKFGLSRLRYDDGNMPVR